jgi:glycosyltransferase involved in cell wall biosynthesis
MWPRIFCIGLASRVADSKITVIAYGAVHVKSASAEPVLALGLEPGRYLSVIARAEPENSLLEIVKGFSAKPRGFKLVVLGTYAPDIAYHCEVRAAASSEVCFVGAIYDKCVVQAIRFHSLAYVHGHQVGGTNPSLVEAMGAGNAILAHDNRFNRWVVGEGAEYFTDADSFSKRLDDLAENPGYLKAVQSHVQSRFQRLFTWPLVLEQYEELLTKYLPQRAPRQQPSNNDVSITAQSAGNSGEQKQ